EPSSWRLDTLLNNTTDARYPEETHLSAAMHAALRCLGMQVHLEVTEEGNVCCVSCTDGATIAWATLRYDEGSVICREHAQVCTISATSGSLLPVVPWDGEERACGAGRFHWHLPNKDCRGASVPVAESIETGRGTPPKEVDLAAPQKHPSPEEKWIHPGCPDRPREASLGGRDRSSETNGTQASPPTPGDDTAVAAACPCPLLLLLASAAAVVTLHGVAVWTALCCEATALPPAWPALIIGCPIEKNPFQWVPFSICMCYVRSV
ncbi:surface protease GP63, partial [Trypanosoma cruzi]